MANEATIILGALNMADMTMDDASHVPSPGTPNEPQRVVIDSRLIILHLKLNGKDRMIQPRPNSTGFSVGVKVEPHLGWINSVTSSSGEARILLDLPDFNRMASRNVFFFIIVIAMGIYF